MATVAVDTNVVSYVFKQDTRARRFRQHLVGRDLVLSFMTLAELDQWALQRRWGQQRRADLERFLQGYRVHYADRFLCSLWAEVMERANRQGTPMDKADAWIAATALALGVPLVTHNAADFRAVAGLTVLTEP